MANNEGTPLHGDRSAWNTTDHAGEHARDIDESALLRHLPSPTSSGNFAVDDGTNWQTKTEAEVLAQLSGKATAAFSFNDQDIDGVGVINLVSKSPTPASGDVWNGGAALHFQPASDDRAINLSDGVIVADTTAANTTTETTIFTETVSADELFKGSKWHTRLSGYYSTTNATDTFTMCMKLGGTTIHSFTSTAENVTNGFFRVEWFFTVRSTGAAGTVQSAVDGIFNTTDENEANTSADTIDTTVAENITITVQWSAADASNTLTITQGHTDIFGVEQS